MLLAWPPVHAVCPSPEVVVFQPRTWTSLYLGFVTIFATILDSSYPTCFNRFWISCFTSLYLSPISPPYSTRQRRFALSFHPLLPPNLPGRGTTVNLDSAPTHQPPPLVCAYLPCRASTRSSLSKPVSDVPRMFPPPFPSLTCSQVPIIPRCYPIRGSLPPSACLHRPHVCSPPCWSRPAA